MEIKGARIYDDGVGISREAEEKIRKIVHEIKTVATSTDLGIRFVKNGRMIEGLLWAKADELPIGIYTRGISLSTVLDTIQRKVERECIKVKKFKFAKTVTKMNRNKNWPIEMAG